MGLSSGYFFRVAIFLAAVFVVLLVAGFFAGAALRAGAFLAAAGFLAAGFFAAAGVLFAAAMVHSAFRLLTIREMPQIRAYATEFLTDRLELAECLHELGAEHLRQ